MYFKKRGYYIDLKLKNISRVVCFALSLLILWRWLSRIVVSVSRRQCSIHRAVPELSRLINVLDYCARVVAFDHVFDYRVRTPRMIDCWRQPPAHLIARLLDVHRYATDYFS